MPQRLDDRIMLILRSQNPASPRSVDTIFIPVVFSYRNWCPVCLPLDGGGPGRPRLTADRPTDFRSPFNPDRVAKGQEGETA
jgi:hypothetical protein